MVETGAQNEKIVVIVGDIKPEKAKELANKYFIIADDFVINQNTIGYYKNIVK